MKSKLFFLILATIFLLTACKDDASKFRVKTSYHIKKINFGGYEETTGDKTDTFYYTSDGKRDFSKNGMTVKEEKNGNTIVWTTYDKEGKVVESTTSFLNERGLEDSVVITNAAHVTYTHKYIYDDKRFVIEDRQTSSDQASGMTWKYKVVDGNRVEETLLPSVDTIVMVNPQTLKLDTIVQQSSGLRIHKEYFLDKLNFPTVQNYGYENKDINSKNLEKGAVQLSPKGDTEDVYHFRYVFDNKGRVISAAQISRSGNEYDSTAYTYY